eukprot:gnl/MRDRNA2_/MRDRNA2_37777_c0_seq1.p1 gnl/MRDRNA2_/MRDRNA2_37777_c0~~gnl/MRDRNA2_/MRDRNA2_37777_c0_seq1.p1  ORF type:complete len:280 (+),score=39.57 gnl/MRDRNA2_/MRDRNA2_37777_c0_seq1:117-842(+)
MIPMFPEIIERASALRDGTEINDFLCGHAWNPALEALLELAWPVAIHGSFPRGLAHQQLRHARLHLPVSKREHSHPFIMNVQENSLSRFRNPRKFNKVEGPEMLRWHRFILSGAIAVMYHKGTVYGLAQNFSKARYFYKYAARHGSIEAKMKLGWLQLFTSPRRPAAAWQTFRELSGAKLAMKHLSQPAIVPKICEGLAQVLAPGYGDGQVWRCRGGNCIDASGRCDGVQNCLDSSDEEGC